MKIPFFVSAVLITILCFMLFIKSLDYGQAWAIILSVVGLLTFAVLSIISLLYQMRQHEGDKGHH
jgi:cell division protein FtsW (lipid II flippase)